MKSNGSLHIATLVILLTVQGCDLFSKRQQNTDDIVARVYERYLYRSDIEEIIPANLNSKDSVAFVQNYITVWAKNQLMIYKAEFNLPEDQKDFDDQIRNYRNDLLKFAYEQQYIEQKLDTNISSMEIAEFYADNADNFQLRENILKAHYTILPLGAPQLEEAREWFRSGVERNHTLLKDHSLKYAREFSFDDSSWVSFDLFIKKFPLEVQDQNEFLAESSIIEESDSSYVYLIEVVDYKLKNGLSPLAYVRNVIRNIILNRRKLELLANLERDLLNDAIDKQEFETY